MTPTQTNHLSGESSPYLLQHAHNPVAWYPWSDEALTLARRLDKPILLSIGYSSCHWCHVMAHESFEDPEIAALMNRHFVNIKVDREERPDIDGLYMEAVQRMTGSGGWPLTVFLTPDLVPFFGGTYFPPVPRHGMPSFPQLLASIAQAWQERRPEIEESAAAIRLNLTGQGPHSLPEGSLDDSVLDEALENLKRNRDERYGGFGQAPKFPQPMVLDFLLDQYAARGDDPGLGWVKDHLLLTLRGMARGGLFDQLGGGFHRYSTDAWWLVPHFEKMLYDNAQLARTYLRAWQVFKDEEFKQVAERTLDYLLREMRSAEGGFYSAQDADSEGVEGRFFVWTIDEVLEVLDQPTGELLIKYFGMTETGNFPEAGAGKNILFQALSLDALAQETGKKAVDLGQLMRGAVGSLLAERELRVKPQTDTKQLAEWNGLSLSALAEAAFVLNRADYLQAAMALAAFIEEKLIRPDNDGSLLLARSYKSEGSTIEGFLEDYASVALGLLDLFKATQEAHWLYLVYALTGAMIDRFADPEAGGFFQSSITAEALLTRRKEETDNALPSGNSQAALLLQRLGRLTGNSEWQALAEKWLRTQSSLMRRFPSSFGTLLQAAQQALHPGLDLCLIKGSEATEAEQLLEVIQQTYLPGSLFFTEKLALFAQADPSHLEGKIAQQGKATLYICQYGQCLPPVTSAVEAATALQKTAY